MQIIDKRAALLIPPVLRLGFRPFFLLGSLLALMAVPLWLLALQGDVSGWQPVGGWLAWHRHELLFGFVGAIIAGFLLTAVQTWTGRPSISGKPLALLALIWLAARMSWLLAAPMWLLVLLNLAFPLLVFAQMARLIWAVRQRNNYPIVVVLLLLALADAQVLVSMALGEEGWQRQGVLAALWLVAGLMGVIGGRVIPFFTQRGLGRATAVQPWVKLDWAILLGSLLVAVLHALGLALLPSGWLGLLFVLLSIGHGIRLYRWFDKGYVQVPLLWSLHLAYGWLLLACVGMALWHLGLIANYSQPLHALTVGSMAGLILAMLARVSLGHTGRPLELPVGMAAGFLALNFAALARVFLVGVWPQQALWLAVLGWVLAFGLYLWRYGPMLCQTRADGHPG